MYGLIVWVYTGRQNFFTPIPHIPFTINPDFFLFTYSALRQRQILKIFSFAFPHQTYIKALYSAVN